MHLFVSSAIKFTNHTLFIICQSDLVKFILPIGVRADIAVSKHEHWSSLAPLPFEVVISAGQKAKEESWQKGKCLSSQ